MPSGSSSCAHGAFGTWWCRLTARHGVQTVPSLWWCNHLKIRRGWSRRLRFHHHAFKNLLRHGRATDDTTLVCNLCRRRRYTSMTLERSVVESAGFFFRETWQEEHFCETDTFSAAGDGVSVWDSKVFPCRFPRVDVSAVSWCCIQ